MVIKVKTIKEEEYHKSMGLLIDVRHPLLYKEEHHPDSINIYYNELLVNYKKYLDKNKKYFIMCKEGRKSKQAVRILSFYGYDVTYVINS